MCSLLLVYRTRADINSSSGGKGNFGSVSLRLAEGSSNGGDEVRTDMGKGGGGEGDNIGEGGDSGSDGDGSGGSGGEGVELNRNPSYHRYAGCGGGVAADSSSLEGSVSLSRWADRSWILSGSSIVSSHRVPPWSVSGTCQVTSSGLRHLSIWADPQQHLHHQHALGLETNIWRELPALAPQGQARNLERVGLKERPPCMGPLASKAAQGTRDHRLSVILCLINP
ncbi:hypothetical protein Tco_1329380 [Tanacetum coccineum]